MRTHVRPLERSLNGTSEALCAANPARHRLCEAPLTPSTVCYKRSHASDRVCMEQITRSRRFRDIDATEVVGFAQHRHFKKGKALASTVCCRTVRDRVWWRLKKDELRARETPTLLPQSERIGSMIDEAFRGRVVRVDV